MTLNSDENSGANTRNKVRIDFQKDVPEILYKRAGGRCSVPRCKNPTMGPFIENDGAANMGMACHIFSAAENGPRGRGGKDASFISSAENGIWCCTTHGTLIDKAKGKDYSAPTLFAWKKLAEARVLKQMNDVPSPLGWVDSIEFTKFANREGLPKIGLSRYTIMLGSNGAGKSVLLEIAASINNAEFGERFFGSKIKSADGTFRPAEFSAQVTYSTVDSLDKKIHIEIRDNLLTRFECGVPCLLPPGDIEILLATVKTCQREDGEDDVEYFMRILNIDKTALLALAKIGTKSIMPGEIVFRNAVEEDDEGNSFDRIKENGKPYIEMSFKKNGRDSFLPFNALSGSEQVRLTIDMFISKAREVCRQRLTLLMVDDVISGLDEKNYANLLSKLSEEDFQSVVILPPGRRKEVLEMVDGKPQIKEADHLSPWRLVVVDALEPLR